MCVWNSRGGGMPRSSPNGGRRGFQMTGALTYTYYKEYSKESTRCKTYHSDAKPKCKLHCILKANEFIEKSICIILFKTWFTCLDKEIFLFII